MTPQLPKRFTVVPMGGLGNRMRVIRSAYALALEAGADVRVAFAENAECRCRFEDVFAELGLPSGNFRISPAEWLDTPPSRLNLHLPQMARKFFYGLQLNGFSASDKETVLRISAASQSVYISTCYEFFGNALEMSSLFKPSAAVNDAVEAFTGRFGGRTVGFHVRTTDNAPAVSKSPCSLFEEAARRELDAHPETIFFLATDSNGVKRRFVSEFGSRVITSDAELSRSSFRGMIAAAADMFALSHCDAVYGSHYSSFSEIAAELGGKRAKILRLP